MSKVKKLFVTSDIHGHCTVFKEALDVAGFDRSNDDHLLVCCGDYFDRGNENDQVLRFLESIQNKVLLRGNHEDLLLDLLYSGKLQQHHFLNGTMNTIENFFGKYAARPDATIDFSGKTRIVDRLCDFIEETLDYFETKNYVFVHGWLPLVGETFEGRKAISKELWKKARWEGWHQHYQNKAPLVDKALVCGHIPASYASRFDMNRAPADNSIFHGCGLFALDACTAVSGKINVLVLEDELL